MTFPLTILLYPEIPRKMDKTKPLPVKDWCFVLQFSLDSSGRQGQLRVLVYPQAIFRPQIWLSLWQDKRWT